jgi:hypothetical protein
MLGSLPRIIRTVSMPERLFRERHRRICAVGMFQDKRSALGVATAIILRACPGPGLWEVQGHGTP